MNYVFSSVTIDISNRSVYWDEINIFGKDTNHLDHKEILIEIFLSLILYLCTIIEVTSF